MFVLFVAPLISVHITHIRMLVIINSNLIFNINIAICTITVNMLHISVALNTQKWIQKMIQCEHIS